MTGYVTINERGKRKWIGTRKSSNKELAIIADNIDTLQATDDKKKAIIAQINLITEKRQTSGNISY